MTDMPNLIIAIDGTLASGKGTLARFLSSEYELPHLDTGLLYRALAALALKTSVALDDEDALADKAETLNLADFDEADLRTAEVGQAASKVAAYPKVRKALFELQREFAFQDGGAVLDGRDIGTVVCPEAQVKIWVDADIRTRAERRVAELNAKGDPITVDEMLEQLEERDKRDRTRDVAPMRPADDAHLLDTSHLSIDAAKEEARHIVDRVRASLSRS